MRLFQTTTNDFQKMFQNDPWLFNINTCMLQDKVYPSKLLIQHNLHSISDYLTQNMLESVPSATAGHSSGIYCGQKSVYATTKPNKSARPSLALDSTFLFFIPVVFGRGKVQFLAILDWGVFCLGTFQTFPLSGRNMNTTNEH